MGACQTKKQFAKQTPSRSASSPSPIRRVQEKGNPSLRTSPLECQNHYPIMHICLNPSCQHRALFCSKDSCTSCSVVHSSCRTVDLPEIVSLIEQRSANYDKMIANMNDTEKQIVSEILKNKQKQGNNDFSKNIDQHNGNVNNEILLSRETSLELKGKDALEFYNKLIQSDKPIQEKSNKFISNNNKKPEQTLALADHKENLIQSQNQEGKLKLGVPQPIKEQDQISKFHQKSKDSAFSKRASKDKISNSIQKQQSQIYSSAREKQSNIKGKNSQHQNFQNIKNGHVMRSEMISQSLYKFDNNYYSSMPKLYNHVESNGSDSKNISQSESKNARVSISKRQQSLEQSNIILPNNKQLLPRLDSKIFSKKDKSQLYFLAKQLGFPKQISLLFRASDNQFDSNKFHDVCDNIPQTLTVLKTQFDKVVVGYTPLRWNKDQGYVSDTSKQTFLLSMDEKQKMTLVNQKKAIQCLSSYGPVFGSGDIAISNKCHIEPNSLTYFASSFNNDDMYQSNQSSWSTLCGVKQGNHFKIVEYEIFQVKW